MQLSDIPAWFAKRFAADATGTYVRTVPATTVDPAAASMTLGFPPATFTPIGAGGVPMDGRDLNGILNYLSAWSQWSGLGGPAPWSSTISAAAGGYPLGAVVLSGTVTGRQYQSTVNNNVTNPDTGGAGWRILVTQPATAGETTTGTSDERVITPLRLAGALAGLSVVTPAQLAAAIAAAVDLAIGSAAQSWQVLTGSRSSGTTYTNSTIRPIQVLVSCADTFGGTASVSVVVAGTAIISGLTYDGGDSVGVAIPSFIVPAGATYSVSVLGASINRWSELR